MSKNGSKFNFDEEFDRSEVPALKVHPNVLGENHRSLFAAGVADMDFKISRYIVEAVQKRAEHEVLGYEAVPDTLFPALINWLKNRHQWEIQSSDILRAPNVLNILATAATCFTQPGDGIIVQPPVFFDFYDILKENHRQLILNPLTKTDGGYEMDFDDLERKAALPQTKMLFLCSPHNPVGRVWRREELSRLGEICLQHDVIVVSDEIHSDIIYSGHKHIPYASLGENFAENSITCVSPAKSFNIASCCSAYAITPNEDFRKAIQAENSRYTVNKNNAFANVAMLAAYEQGGPWLDAVNNYLEDNVGLVRERIKDIPNVKATQIEGTFLMWLDFSNLGLSDDALHVFLREKANWAVTRGDRFGEQGSGFCRVNIACTRKKLENALDQLALAAAQI